MKLLSPKDQLVDLEEGVVTYETLESKSLCDR